MSGSRYKKSILARDQKHFLILTEDEVNFWIPRVFECVQPVMPLIRALMLQDSAPGGEDEHTPVDLEAVLMIAARPVREVAAEMANALLTPTRLNSLFPRLNAYCDELLAQNRPLEAAFVQQELLRIRQGCEPAQVPLLVEICLRSIDQQVSLINGSSPPAARSL